LERKWVVVAFGDIRGFGLWTSRAANSPEVKEPFINDFYKTLEDYVCRHKDIHFKYMGDGFLVLQELGGRDSEGVYKFLKKVRSITKRVLLDIKRCPYPNPAGFRIRIASGDVYKRMVIDPNDPERKRKIPEYVEYATNKAAHLLMVNPELTCLITESVIKALGKYRSFFRLRKLAHPSSYPESVNKIDIDGLRILRF